MKVHQPVSSNGNVKLFMLAAWNAKISPFPRFQRHVFAVFRHFDYSILFLEVYIRSSRSYFDHQGLLCNFLRLVFSFF